LNQDLVYSDFLNAFKKVSNVSPIILFIPRLISIKTEVIGSQPYLGDKVALKIILSNKGKDVFETSKSSLMVESQGYKMEPFIPMMWNREKVQIMQHSETIVKLVPELEYLSSNLGRPVPVTIHLIEGDVVLDSTEIDIVVKVPTLNLSLKPSTLPRFSGRQFEIDVKVETPKNENSLSGFPVNVQIPNSKDFEVPGESQNFQAKIGEVKTIVVTPLRAGLPGYPLVAFFTLKLGETQVEVTRLSLHVLPNPLNIAVAVITAVSAIFAQIGPGPITLGSIITAIGGGYSILRLLSWALNTQKT
jgi:hypothetical protein